MSKHPAQVGDLIQYHYRVPGFVSGSAVLTTREVIEVIEEGAAFIVDGGFRVQATKITTHIPMHHEEKPAGDYPEASYDWCGKHRRTK